MRYARCNFSYMNRITLSSSLLKGLSKAGDGGTSSPDSLSSAEIPGLASSVTGVRVIGSFVVNNSTAAHSMEAALSWPSLSALVISYGIPDRVALNSEIHPKENENSETRGLSLKESMSSI